MDDTVDYSAILRGIFATTGVAFRTLADLDREEVVAVQAALELHLETVWRAHRWPDVVKTQERWYRDDWSAGTTYAKGAEVYYPPARHYYQALRDGNLNNAPAIGAAYVENAANWAVCQTGYSGDTWLTATAYAVGKIVYDAVTDEYYQCHTAHTSSGTLVPEATGGNERWGVLTPFDRYVPFTQTGRTTIGDVLRVLTENPKRTTRYREVAFERSEQGVQIAENLTSVWVELRRRRPRLDADEYSATVTYAPGRQAYYEVGGVGNLYQALQSTFANLPTDTANWELVAIPAIFKRTLVEAGRAMWLERDGQEDKATRRDRKAEAALMFEADELQRQEQQVRRPRVGTR